MKKKKLVDVGVTNLQGYFKDGVLKECDDVCEKMRGRRSNRDKLWWNEEGKEAASKKKNSHKTMSEQY